MTLQERIASRKNGRQAAAVATTIEKNYRPNLEVRNIWVEDFNHPQFGRKWSIGWFKPGEQQERNWVEFDYMPVSGNNFAEAQAALETAKQLVASWTY